MKLAILGTVLLGGGILFSSELTNLFLETSSETFTSVINDLNAIKDETIPKVEDQLDNGINQVNEKLNNFQNSTTETVINSVDEKINSIQDKKNYRKFL